MLLVANGKILQQKLWTQGRLNFLGNTNKRDREILGIPGLAVWRRVFTTRLLAMYGDIFGKPFGSGWGVITDMGFSGGSDRKESTCNAGDLGSIPGLGKSPGGGPNNPLRYSCLENRHGQRGLGSYSAQDGREWATADWPSNSCYKQLLNSKTVVINQKCSWTPYNTHESFTDKNFSPSPKCQ